LASNVSITAVFSTWVLVVTNDLYVVDNSSYSITPISSTCVLVIDNYRAEYTSS